MYNTILFFILFCVSLLNFENYSFSISPQKGLESGNVKYFRKKEFKKDPKKKFVYFQFCNKIEDNKNSIIFTLKQLDIQGKSYYKVFYDHLNQIQSYQFFNNGYLVSFALFSYQNDIKNVKNLYKVDYYNALGKSIGRDFISNTRSLMKFKIKGVKLL